MTHPAWLPLPPVTAADLLAGTPREPLLTPLLDAAAALHGGRAVPAAAYLSDTDEVRVVATRPALDVDAEFTELASWKRRALQHEAERDAAVEDAAIWHEAADRRLLRTEEVASERDAATMAASGATVRANAAERLLEAERARTRELGGQLREAWGLLRDLRSGTTLERLDEIDKALLACPSCGCGPDACPLDSREDCATYHGLPTHGEVMAMPGHEAAERREHPSDPPVGIVAAAGWDGCSARVPGGQYEGCCCTLKGHHSRHEAWSLPANAGVPVLIASWETPASDERRLEAAHGGEGLTTGSEAT